MKEIKAYIRCERALTALDALNEAGMQHATLTHVLAVGAEADCDQAEMNIEFGCRVNRMVKMEVICLDKDEPKIVELIRKAVCTLQPGDGIITVTNVNRVVKVRTAAVSVDPL
ncbi:MAG: P-II family nitrogen regulator [Desulfobacterales bacterium]|jgi:nitrogen regulatory protein PII